MKKKINIISTFLIIITMICGVFTLTNSNNVKAAESTQIIYLREDQVISQGTYGKITLSKNGEITMEYTYGFSELLILAIPCVDSLNDGETLEDKTTCDNWATNSSLIEIIHIGGERGRGSKNIHLSNYFATIDQLVKVSFVYEFATNNNSSNSFFNVLYCDTGACPSTGNYSNTNFIFQRIKYFKNNEPSLSSVENKDTIQHKSEGKKLVYRGSSSFSSGVTPNTTTLNTITKTESYSAYIRTSDLAVKIANTKQAELGESEFEKLVYDTIIPVLLAVLALCAIVSSTVIGIKIVKASDDPQERQEKVRALRNILIGLAFAFVVLMVAEPIINFVKGFLE